MKYISMQALVLAALTATAFTAQAHMRMPGPLPKEFLEHRDDISWLKQHVNTDDSSKQFYGLHFYYALDLEAQKLTVKLLNSEDVGAQMAALGIIRHCGGEASDTDVLSAINSRIGILSESKHTEVRKSALGARRALRKSEKERKSRASKKTARP